ncbi:MAG TPA: 3-dehydro-L-gulonate 2-dehydrogenase [Pyrinomonadaceae bacterium]|nr:3-dehydro-L-gulonate 2-dehydrogenase [Pyrinomonadaceae bacterium]
MRVTYRELFETLSRVLLKIGFQEQRAMLCARLFAETTRDGVYSHGLNRFPRFLRMVRNGSIDIHAEPELIAAYGSLERWDGLRGAGNLNAYKSMERAISLATTNGMGCVALSDTNHWMRGGSYGWQAAEAGMIGICWTNTLPNLPPWGASRARLGNNPLVIAVPRASGHVVLDMAISQFSFGALESYRERGEQLPVEGGFDSEGNLTRDPAEIEKSGRVLPIGYWKGSGLSLVLDMIAALLSGGLATHQIAPDPERETQISQVFIAINLPALDQDGYAEHLADQIIESLQTPPTNGGHIRYPGEKTLQTRKENMEKGIPVEEAVWDEVRSLL